MSRKRILVITPFFYPQVGGSQQFMEDIYANLIKRHPAFRVDVLCYNTKNQASLTMHGRLSIYRIPCWDVLPGQFVLPKPLALIRFLFAKRHEYDTIHCSTRFFDSSWWAPLYAKLFKKKIILTDHCANHPIHNSKFVNAIAKIIDSTIVRWSLVLYDEIYVTNKAAKQFMRKFFGLNPKVMYGGVDTTIFKPLKNKKNNKRIKVIFAGRMIKSKGIVEIFSVAKILKDLDFILVGDGSMVDVINRKISSEKLENIRVLGNLNKRKLAKVLASSDIFIHPSYHHEGFPNALLEAGACKLSVIATNVGGTKEIITHQKTGILIKTKNTEQLKNYLKKLSSNSNLRKKLSCNLYKKIMENFTWNNLSKKLYYELTR